MTKPTKTITGELVCFNISPKGIRESFMMKVGAQLVQLNFPHGAGQGAAREMKSGQTLTVHTQPFDDEHSSDHAVYELVHDDTDAVEGKVKQINYSLHGEPNGAILESGEFVHMRPHGARAIKLKLGQELSVIGDSRKSHENHIVIEATKINGISID